LKRVGGDRGGDGDGTFTVTRADLEDSKGSLWQELRIR
jgi:hypothetical protein